MSLAALERYARRRARRVEAGTACELCAAPAGDAHAHVVDLERRAVCCACATCARLFAGAGAGRYRAVPDRVRFDPALALPPARWAELQIPVGLAFVFFSSPARRWVALYPSPAGPVESELPLDAWERLAAESPLLASAAPDVEAILVRGERGAESLECFLVPIDLPYELVGRIRRRWRGLDGGDDVRGEIARFFEALRARARPLGGAR